MNPPPVHWHYRGNDQYRGEIDGHTVHVQRLGQGQWSWTLPCGQGYECGVESDMEQVARSVRDTLARLAAKGAGA
jgi:hypothetical protein